MHQPDAIGLDGAVILSNYRVPAAVFFQESSAWTCMSHRWRLGRSATGSLALYWSANGAAMARSASDRPVSQIHSRLLRCASRTFAASITSRSPRATSMGSGEPIPAKDLIEFSQLRMPTPGMKYCPHQKSQRLTSARPQGSIG